MPKGFETKDWFVQSEQPDEDQGKPAVTRSYRLEYALVILFFLCITIVFTWPLILHVHDGTLGGHGDTLLNTWIMSWNARTLFSHPGNLFQGNIIYPSRDVLAYSEIMFIESLLAAPLFFATRNPVLAYNVVLILGAVFATFGCYLLIKELTGSRWGGIAGGVFFALCPYKISKIGHLQIFFSPFMPFMILYLFRYLAKGGRKHLFSFGAFFLLQSLSSWHYLAFCSLSVALMLFWVALCNRKRRQWARIGWAAAIVVLAVVATVPLAIPYFRANARLPHFERSLEESEYWSAQPGDFLRVIPESVLYGSAPGPFREGNILAENVFYPGISVIVLALAGLIVRKREDDTARVFEKDARMMGGYFALLTMVSVTLMFGPRIGGVGNPLYYLLYHLGALRFIRMPSRFFVNVALGLSVLCGYGIAKISFRMSLWRKNPAAGRLAAICLVLLLLLEILTFNLTVYAVPVWGEVPEVYSWLSEQGDVRIIELPTLRLENACTDFRVLPLNPVDLPSYLFREGMLMYLSTYHWKKTVNGYSGYLPFFYKRIMSEMQGFPSARTVELLSALDIDYVIWHWNWVDEDDKGTMHSRLDSAAGLELYREFDGISVYKVEDRIGAGVDDLQVSLLAPRSTLENTPLNAGIMVRNGSADTFISVEERQQQCIITFMDEKGATVQECRSSYPAPFFLAAGESTVLPVRVDSSLPAGDYTMALMTAEGVLAPLELYANIQVLHTEEMGESGMMAGSVAVTSREIASIPAPDGLFPLELTVRNEGDVYWESSWDSGMGVSGQPLGFVSLILRWGQRESLVWKEESCVLPCDLSPGDVVEMPILVRPPDKPGRYQMFIGLHDEDIGWFGTPALMDVEIKESGEPQ